MTVCISIISCITIAFQINNRVELYTHVDVVMHIKRILRTNFMIALLSENCRVWLLRIFEIFLVEKNSLFELRDFLFSAFKKVDRKGRHGVKMQVRATKRACKKSCYFNEWPPM